MTVAWLTGQVAGGSTGPGFFPWPRDGFARWSGRLWQGADSVPCGHDRCGPEPGGLDVEPTHHQGAVAVVLRLSDKPGYRVLALGVSGGEEGLGARRPHPRTGPALLGQILGRPRSVRSTILTAGAACPSRPRRPPAGDHLPGRMAAAGSRQVA